MKICTWSRSGCDHDLKVCCLDCDWLETCAEHCTDIDVRTDEGCEFLKEEARESSAYKALEQFIKAIQGDDHIPHEVKTDLCNLLRPVRNLIKELNCEGEKTW